MFCFREGVLVLFWNKWLHMNATLRGSIDIETNLILDETAANDKKWEEKATGQPEKSSG